MRSLFPGYYRPNASEFEALWSNCTFIPDANILLNVYRYPPDARQTLLSILEQIRDRLWVPHQSALEFMKRRCDAMVDQLRAYNSLREALGRVEVSLQAFDSFKKRSPVNVGDFLDTVRQIVDKFSTELAAHEEHLPVISADDPMLTTIEKLLDGRIGNSFQQARIDDITKEGAIRYSKKIPPGYKDSDKSGDDKYGDLVMWYQILEYADQSKKPIIFLTDDKKEDWWWKIGDTTVGPRPELIEECQTKSDQTFYMYDAARFVEYAQTYLRRNDSEAAIEEVKDIGRMDEEADRSMWATLPPSDLLSRDFDSMGVGIDYLAELAKASVRLQDMFDNPITRFLEAERERNRKLYERLVSPTDSLKALAALTAADNDFKQQASAAFRAAIWGPGRPSQTRLPEPPEPEDTQSREEDRANHDADQEQEGNS